jgi:hypothetical protein
MRAAIRHGADPAMRDSEKHDFAIQDATRNGLAPRLAAPRDRMPVREPSGENRLCRFRLYRWRHLEVHVCVLLASSRHEVFRLRRADGAATVQGAVIQRQRLMDDIFDQPHIDVKVT